jgi:aminoglycoside phosphotransferase (APT) family kinase protein
MVIESIISLCKSRLNIDEDFSKAQKGTRSQVYLSDNYVIKINKDPEILEGEKEILSGLDFNSVPKVLDFFTEQGQGVLVEKRLPGDSLDESWRHLPEETKNEIIFDLVGTVKKVHQIKKDKFWWARHARRHFVSYAELLLDRLEDSKIKIEKNKIASRLFKGQSDNLKKENLEKVFIKIEPVLVHGDLIIHNLLTDGKKLTGILDWEFSQYGDPFYDLARVVYYQECAKAYDDSGTDEIFEYDFTGRLISGLKSVMEYDEAKYRILRGLFFAESIAWAAASDNPEKNLAELKPPEL